MWTRRSIDEAGGAFGEVTVNPSIRALSGDAQFGSNMGGSTTRDKNAIDEQLAAATVSLASAWDKRTSVRELRRQTSPLSPEVLPSGS